MIVLRIQFGIYKIYSTYEVLFLVHTLIYKYTYEVQMCTSILTNVNLFFPKVYVTAISHVHSIKDFPAGTS